MSYGNGTYELLNALNRNNRLLWEIKVKVNETVYPIQFEASEAEVLSSLLNLNQDLLSYNRVMLESFLYELDANPDDIRMCYADEIGWSLQCSGCHHGPQDGWIEHEFSHEQRGDDIVFLLSLDPEPCSGVLVCLGR